MELIELVVNGLDPVCRVSVVPPAKMGLHWSHSPVGLAWRGRCDHTDYCPSFVVVVVFVVVAWLVAVQLLVSCIGSAEVLGAE